MALDALLAFLRRLETAGIHYHLGSYRDSVNVSVTTPTNERWKVEFFSDGSIEVGRFVPAGDITTDVSILDSFSTSRRSPASSAPVISNVT